MKYKSNLELLYEKKAFNVDATPFVLDKSISKPSLYIVYYIKHFEIYHCEKTRQKERKKEGESEREHETQMFENI